MRLLAIVLASLLLCSCERDRKVAEAGATVREMGAAIKTTDDLATAQKLGGGVEVLGAEIQKTMDKEAEPAFTSQEALQSPEWALGKVDSLSRELRRERQRFAQYKGLAISLGGSLLTLLLGGGALGAMRMLKGSAALRQVVGAVQEYRKTAPEVQRGLLDGLLDKHQDEQTKKRVKKAKRHT